MISRLGRGGSASAFVLLVIVIAMIAFFGAALSSLSQTIGNTFWNHFIEALGLTSVATIVITISITIVIVIARGSR